MGNGEKVVEKANESSGRYQRIDVGAVENKREEM